MHIHNIFYIKTFEISPTCFEPKIIFRELYCSLLCLYILYVLPHTVTVMCSFQM